MSAAAADDDAAATPEDRGEPPTHLSAHVPRIVVIGSESTGKTTLAAQLAQAMGTLWVPEYSRVYAEQVQRMLTAADVEPIARGQVAAENAGEAAWRARFASAHRPPPVILQLGVAPMSMRPRHVSKRLAGRC